MEKRRPVKAFIHNLDQATTEDLKKSDSLKQLLYIEVPKCVEYANKNKKLFATVFEINDSNMFLEIHKKDWTSALETCVKYYIEKEDYEFCNKLKNLIEEIKLSSTKLTINKREVEDE